MQMCNNQVIIIMYFFYLEEYNNNQQQHNIVFFVKFVYNKKDKHSACVSNCCWNNCMYA